MKYQNWSLKRRILLAYLCHAVCFVAFFALIAVLAVEGIETHLVDQRLRETAKWAQPRYRGGMPVEMPAGMSFHYGAAIPRSLRHLGNGVHDVKVDGVGLHVLAGSDEKGPYVVVDHQSDYDKVELVVYTMFGLGFIGFVGFSYLLAGFVVRGVVTPMTALAHAVLGGDMLSPSGGPPEVQLVAQAFAEREAELRSALQRERFFTGDASHELRTGLAVVMGAAEVLSAQHPAGPSAAPTERILRAARAASDTVGVLLQLSRAPSPEQADVVEVDRIAAAQVQRAQHLVQGKPVRLAYLGGDAFTARVPRQLCEAAIGHLVRVACECTMEGSVSVRLEEGQVVIEDTGPGLPAAVRCALQGGDMSSFTGSAGTGFGLGIVQRICDHLQCPLTVSDRPGGGTVFALRLGRA
jgi:signal transduction histidine kinase